MKIFTDFPRKLHEQELGQKLGFVHFMGKTRVFFICPIVTISTKCVTYYLHASENSMASFYPTLWARRLQNFKPERGLTAMRLSSKEFRNGPPRIELGSYSENWRRNHAENWMNRRIPRFWKLRRRRPQHLSHAAEMTQSGAVFTQRAFTPVASIYSTQIETHRSLALHGSHHITSSTHNRMMNGMIRRESVVTN